MKIDLIALDLDGTLLDADHATIPARNLDALRKAAAQGVKLAITSGRSWSLIRETARALGPVRYGVTANGAFVLDAATGEKLGQTGMDKDQCRAIVRVLRKYGLPYELYIDGENYVQRSDTGKMGQYALTPAFLDVFLRNATLVDDMLDAVDLGVPEKFDVFYVPPEVRVSLVAELEATGPFNSAGALQKNLELTAAGICKGDALRALCETLKIPPERVMAFGDADNDLEMLAWAGWSFAMENGVDEARRTAKFVAPPNTEAGVGQMVEKYILS